MDCPTTVKCVNMSICLNATFQLRYQNESCSQYHKDDSQCPAIIMMIESIRSSIIYDDNDRSLIRSFLIFRPTSQVNILEPVCPNYLKFDVRIVLYQVPFQIKLHVIRTNRFRDIDLGSWPEKTIIFIRATVYDDRLMIDDRR